MANVISFTPQPIVVLVGANVTVNQDITQAIDVSAYDQLDLLLTINSLTTGTARISLITSLQNNYDDVGKNPSSWVVAGSFPSPAGVGESVLSFPTSGNILLRYARWQLVADLNNGATLSFTLAGMARRKSF